MTRQNPPKKLDYAPPPPWHRRRPTRWAAIAVVVVLLGIILAKIGPVGWRRAQLAYWQNRCMKYSAPADQLVIQFDGAGAKHSIPPEWDRLYAMLSPPGIQSQGTLFLHSRISPVGNHRLVAIDIGSTSGLIVLVARVINPGSFRREPVEVIHPTSATRLPYVLFLGPLKGSAYAGQVDAKNTSHFTVRVVTDQGEYFVDGWLRDDDTVLLEQNPVEPWPVRATTIGGSP